jgi:signal transduction histidine kinase
LVASIVAGALYVGADLLSPSSHLHPGHLPSRVSLMVFLGTALGLLSDRERLARRRAETLNVELAERQASIERAYQDLTEAQERLLQSERLATVGKLAAEVAHEIRNPLGSISLNLELLEDEIEAGTATHSGEAVSLVGTIKLELERLVEITDDYLRLARVPEPKLAYESVGTVLESLGDLLRGEMMERAVEIRLQIEPGLPRVLVDRKQLKQALLNILRNAFDAMPSGGLISISATRADGHVEIAIADQGHGIPPEHLRHIFEPFFTTKATGTGLGLAIAKDIVQGHSGSIDCSSHTGRGTAMTIRIPCGERNRT